MSYIYDTEVTLTAIESPTTRDRLEEYEELIGEWFERLHKHVDCVDPGQIRLFLTTTKNHALRLSKNLPPDLDPVVVAEIRGIVLEGIELLDDDERRPLDVLDDLTVRAESIRHILRDALDETLPCDSEDAAAVTSLLVQWLPRVRLEDIAALVDASPRTLQRWRSEGGRATRRLVLVTRLVAVLRHAWTPEGVVAWFYRARDDLRRRKPIDVLDEAVFEHALNDAARGGRAQHGS
jgi:hypothetical protein